MNYTEMSVDTGTKYVISVASSDHGCAVTYTSKGYGPIISDSVPWVVTSHTCVHAVVTPAATVELSGCTPGPDLVSVPARNPEHPGGTSYRRPLSEHSL